LFHAAYSANDFEEFKNCWKQLDFSRIHSCDDMGEGLPSSRGHEECFMEFYQTLYDCFLICRL